MEEGEREGGCAHMLKVICERPVSSCCRGLTASSSLRKA